jgi:hypothetical protein
MTNLFKRYQETREQLVLLTYQGRLSFDLVQLFIDQIESALVNEPYVLTTKKKIYNVLVEVFQNLNHHIIKHNKIQNSSFDVQKASLKVWIEDKTCYIATGNFIENKQVEKLEAWLNKINSLDSKGIRNLYLEILNNETFSDKGGGGLGFIDISKKTGSKSDFNFEYVNDDLSYFNFEIKINLEV